MDRRTISLHGHQVAYRPGGGRAVVLLDHRLAVSLPAGVPVACHAGPPQHAATTIRTTGTPASGRTARDARLGIVAPCTNPAALYGRGLSRGQVTVATC